MLPFVKPMALLFLALLVPSIAMADAPIVPGGVRADGIAAIVGGEAPGPGIELILRTDVSLLARIAMTGRLGTPAAEGPLPAEVQNFTTYSASVGAAARDAAAARALIDHLAGPAAAPVLKARGMDRP